MGEQIKQIFSLSKNEIMFILIGIAIVIIMTKKIFPLIKEVLKMRKDFYEKIDKRFEEVNRIIEVNNSGTKALLFSQISKLLVSSEKHLNLINSQLYSELQQFIDIYIQMGDGIDGAESFKQRLNKLKVDDIKFNELSTKIINKKYEIMGIEKGD